MRVIRNVGGQLATAEMMASTIIEVTNCRGHQGCEVKITPAPASADPSRLPLVDDPHVGHLVPRARRTIPDEMSADQNRRLVTPRPPRAASESQATMLTL